MLRQGLLPFLELVDSADPYSQLGLGILCCCFLSAGTTDNSEALSEMQVDSWDKDSTPDSYVSPSSLTGSSSQWAHPRQWRKIAKRDVDFFFSFQKNDNSKCAPTSALWSIGYYTSWYFQQHWIRVPADETRNLSFGKLSSDVVSHKCLINAAR